MELQRRTIEYVPIDSIHPFPGNPRRMSEEGMAKLRASLRAFNWTVPCLVQASTRCVIAGNMRRQAAILEGYTEAAAIFMDVDDATAKAINLADNRLSEEAEWDTDGLLAWAEELAGAGFDLTLTGFRAGDLDGLLADLPGFEWPEEPGTGPQRIVDPPVPPLPEVPITQPGDVWLLGRHRLMCGDSTLLDDVCRLVDGVTVDVVFTDPPYNVDYVGGTKDALTIQNDHMGDAAFREFLQAAFTAMYQVCKAGAPIYICHGDTETLNFRLAMRDAGWLHKQCLVWLKNTLVLGRQDYHWQHEPILYGWKPGAAHKWYGGRKQTTLLRNDLDVFGIEPGPDGSTVITIRSGLKVAVLRVPSYEVLEAGGDELTDVWRFDKPARSENHPTSKPVGLPARAMQNSSQPGDSCLDLFGGSGSTLIAAEQLGRVCYTMELDARYCDVIVERWESLTGLKGVRVHENVQVFED